MHSIKLNVNDKIYTHLMYILKSLNQKEIEVVSDEKNTDALNMNKSRKNKMNAISIDTKSFIFNRNEANER